MIRRTAHLVRDAATLARTPAYARPGHFYSPLSNVTDVRRAQAWLDAEPVGVDLRADTQLTLFSELRPALEGPKFDRYQPDSDQYGRPDAAVLQAMLRHHRPHRIIEVGSGHSTAAMLDTADEFYVPGRITCIEPYPDRLLAALRPGDDVELHRLPVQDVDLTHYADLEAGDLLFIDSTHVLKPGSDVAWLYLHVLPRLAPGVLVHIHDIFWPFEYPETWLAQRRDWTELYLLQALLTGSSMWQIEMFSSWLWRTHPDLVPADLRDPGPSNIWLRKVG